MAIRSLAQQIGISQRHLIHLFNQFVGLKPKLFERIGKFQNVLQTIQHSQSVEWAGIAAQFGYTDQSHFIKEFQAFSGLNPSRYIAERPEYPNYVPIR